MSRRDELRRIGILLGVMAHLAAFVLSAHAAPRVASYASQRSNGSPLVVTPPRINAGSIDTAAVRLLARFDDVTLELTPWAISGDGSPRADLPLMLRRLNPSIRIWLYVLAGDQWLPPTFVPGASDHSGFRDVFDAVNAGNGWLYDTAGAQWFPNYRINLADSATVRRLGDVYLRAVSTHLFDGIFLDDAHTSIAWTSRNAAQPLDVERAGFNSLALMDSARLVNVERLIARLHAANPCLLVAVNGTGPKPAGTDVEFREGLGSLISTAQAVDWMRKPGAKWLKAETWGDSASTAATLRLLRGIASYNREAIISAGPDRGWKPEGR